MMTWTWTFLYVEVLLRHIIELIAGKVAPSQVNMQIGWSSVNVQ